MTQRPYTPEMAVDLRLPFEPRLSPDGASVAFRVEPIGHKTKDRSSTIFVAPADGSSAPRPLTGSDANNVSPVWSPDGRSIAFLSDRVKRGTAQAWVVPSAGGEPLQLTDLDVGVGNLSWSRDGRSLLFTARRAALAGEKGTGSEVKVASERWKPHAIASVPATGGAPIVVGPPSGHVWCFSLAPDGASLAAMCSDTEDLAGLWDNLRLVVFSLDGGEPREVSRLNGFPSLPVWSEDGSHLAVVGSRLPNVESTNVFVVHLYSGAVTALDDRGMTPTTARFAAGQLVVHSVDGQRSRVDVTDLRGAEWERLSFGDLDDTWLDSAPNFDVRESAFVLSAARPTSPPDLYAVRDGVPTRLTDLNPQLANIALAGMEEVLWQAPDGQTIHGWLMRPPGNDGSAPLPLVAAIHGGPTWQWGNWFHGTWHDWGQTLAANGYAILLPNPRGGTGRGGAFTGSNRHDYGGGDFNDIMSGIDALIERGVADPERLGVCGWSYGGFMTAWAVTQTDRFKAAVAGAAPTNWVSKIGTTDIRPFNEWGLGEVNREPDRVWERSPIRYAGRVTTPTLIVHGEADPRVPVTQGTEFYLALRAAGVDTDMIVYPRQGHAFHERAFQLDLLKRLVGWFDRYLKPGEQAGADDAAH